VIYGIGVDICDVNRIKEKINNNGNKLVKKILTKEELNNYYKHNIKKAEYVAKCWATKEAFVKALGTGFTEKYNHKNISYIPVKNKKPKIKLDNKLDYLQNIHLSISDELNHVVAMVIIEKEIQ